MGLFQGREEYIPRHPRKEPRLEGELTPERVEEIFGGSVDLGRRQFLLGNDPNKQVELCYVMGQLRVERANDYILHPLCMNPALAAATLEESYEVLRSGGVFSLIVQERTTLDQVVFDMMDGWLAMFFPGKSSVLTFFTATEEKRAVSPPENEPDIKGARDAFVESLRTNTSLVRRRFRAPELRIMEYKVGRQSVTPVDVLWMDGIADSELAAETCRRVGRIDVAALVQTGFLEEYIVDEADTAFPLVVYTERPDRFCAGLAEGRVGILVDGIPMGYLVPGTIDRFFKTGQDKSQNWMVASMLASLRYICMLITLLLPALYIAAAVYRPELIPLKLNLSIIAAKENVPFSTLTEVLVMLFAFEVLQEAGLRLPSSVGQTVSILGGLVVGSAAVEAKIVSPAVLVVVAIAGIAGYTAPSQDMAGALRLWRFGLVVAAGVAGLLGMMLGVIFLVIHLAGLETFGVPYLVPFASTEGRRKGEHAIIREPLKRSVLREWYLNTLNRRNQG